MLDDLVRAGLFLHSLRLFYLFSLRDVVVKLISDSFSQCEKWQFK
jgi:hypothetical protein